MRRGTADQRILTGRIKTSPEKHEFIGLVGLNIISQESETVSVVATNHQPLRGAQGNSMTIVCDMADQVVRQRAFHGSQLAGGGVILHRAGNIESVVRIIEEYKATANVHVHFPVHAPL